jgi:hypothetical protein
MKQRKIWEYPGKKSSACTDKKCANYILGIKKDSHWPIGVRILSYHRPTSTKPYLSVAIFSLYFIQFRSLWVRNLLMQSNTSTPNIVQAPVINRYLYCILYSYSRKRTRQVVGSLKMNTAPEYSTRVVQEGDRRCKKSTLNDLAYLTPLRIPLMNPVILLITTVHVQTVQCTVQCTYIVSPEQSIR